MSLDARVIAGKYRHRKLLTLHNEITRATKDRVKEALFSALNQELEGKVILDLFAGTGALGIEALSRGAKRAIFCEKNEEVSAILKQNIAFIEEETVVLTKSYEHVLSEIGERSIDIIFLDPPYAYNIYTIIQEILAANILKDAYIIAVETDKELVIPLNDVKIKKYKYGLTHVAIIRGIK
jgi:16S rRNA (guanine(966)-N(2))-methyltransferase RsmD